MRYEPGEPTTVTFDTSDELQAIGWAASGMRATDYDDPNYKIAYDAALRATHIRHNGEASNDFTLRGKKADIMLSVIKQWVDLGPPQEETSTFYPAEAKSYKTACAIVARTVELAQN